MYKIKNGVLYQNGRPTLALGTSYYASYHPLKVTVPPEGDKFGEMRRDVRDIALAGFNHIRTCANGAAHWAGDRFCLDTAFTDALVEEAAKNGLCSFVRIQGYSMNQRGHENAQPVDQHGEAGQTTGFVQDTLNHPALNRDADEATRQQAAHFAALPEMLGFQIFNEPAMSRRGDLHLYDYNPLAIAAFREWLVRKGYKTAEEAAALEPPRDYPGPGEAGGLFSLWRQFGSENMSAMLCRLNAQAREAAPGSESFTNFVSTPLGRPGSSCEGDWFACAPGMDILGLDLYTSQRGEDYYSVARRLDEVESAAAAQGKHAWIIEYCCRTHMTVQDYEGEAYAALGSGYKGINYYLWRADLGGPEVQLGGMLWNDRSKTQKFDEAVRFNHMLLREGEKLAACEKLRDGVGILYSLHGAAYYETAQGYGRNHWYQNFNARYAELKKAGITADFIQAEALARNPLGVRLLFVPCLEALDEKEQAQVAAFAREHAVVLESNAFHPACGETVNGVSVVSNWCYRPAGTLGGSDEKIRARFRLPELLRIAGIRPVFRAAAQEDSLGFGFLKSQGEGAPYFVACLVNIQANAAPARAGRLYFDETRTGEICRAEYVDRLGTRPLSIQRGDGQSFVALPDLEQTGGCLVYLYTK